MFVIGSVTTPATGPTRDVGLLVSHYWLQNPNDYDWLGSGVVWSGRVRVFWRAMGWVMGSKKPALFRKRGLVRLRLLLL